MATAVATAILAQGDHPTDDRAFWHSRPIAPLQVELRRGAVLFRFARFPSLSRPPIPRLSWFIGSDRSAIREAGRGR